MNTEFIIGTVISAIGAGATVVEVVQSNKRKAKKTGQNATQLIDSLAEEKRESKQKKILRRIAKVLWSEYKEKISPDYINGFESKGRGKEAIVEAILFDNRIRPTDEICLTLLGNKSPRLKTEFDRKFNSPQAEITDRKPDENVLPAGRVTPVDSGKAGLITPEDTGTVFLSELLKTRFPEPYSRLIAILDRHHIPHKFIKGTKDIWCRDYMPVAVGKGKLVQFRYDPSYLKGRTDWENSRTDVQALCDANGLNPVFSDINLDGGNVLKCGDRVIISDRVFSENPEYTDKKKLIAEIGKLLEAEVIIIPSLHPSSDMTGHVDGMVRFVDRNTLLGNDRKQEFKYWRDGINKVLPEHGMKYIDIPFLEYKKDENHLENALGIYVNYLEIKDLIILPIFETAGNKDAEVVEQFRQIFPGRTIETVNYNPVGLEGGLLNCTTWTLRE
jgi:agmatine/peptidylarginine deiminase